MQKRLLISFAVTGILILSSQLSAHFGMLIPSTSIVTQKDGRKILLNLSFSHPREVTGMTLEKPAEFAMFYNGKKKDLLSSLVEKKIMGKKAWSAEYNIKRPGVYYFYMKPKPYWEPAEDCFIIHYTKTAIGAFGSEKEWDAELGLKTEIVPLTRPFGIYAGNEFRGIVKADGKPVPYAEVEVEFYDKSKKSEPENDYMITQIVKADKNGVFSYTPPAPGWWGFAALTTSKDKMKYKGKEKDVELGAVLWIEFIKWGKDK